MDLNEMLNIAGINAVEEIEKAIDYVKEELKGLTLEQTCMIYNSHLLEELRKRHVQVRLINTTDMGLSYEHYFLLISSIRDYFLADLTYPQFQDEAFPDLNVKGYRKINDISLNRYLSIVEQKPIIDFTCDGLFYKSIDSQNKYK